MIPKKVRKHHAVSQGSVPFPCSYCYHFIPFTMMLKTKGANVVESFIPYNKDEVARCDAGLTAPTSFGDCDRFVHLDTDKHRPQCNESVFQVLERDYMMATLMAIYSKDGITRTELIARNRIGYNTREVRISEMLSYGFITESYNVDNDTCYHLTDSGERLAESLHQLYLATVMVLEEGNLFDSFPDAIRIFHYIHHHKGCSRRMIYDKFEDMEDVEVLTDRLVENDYIQPVYDSTYTELTYETTERGIRAWRTVIRT